MTNTDKRTVDGFGYEWSAFDQSSLADSERHELFDAYFRIFPMSVLTPTAVGIDVGCGSGRWASCVSGRVGSLYCVDASGDAISVAKRNLANAPGCVPVQASAGALPFESESMDFVYSLGVLHHVPDTQAAIAECVRTLKPGAPLLVYLYYDFENRPAWFRLIWRASDGLRRLISRLPHRGRRAASELIATFVYYPLARIARIGETLGMRVDTFPLAAYRTRSFYVMRTDALDRFGTTLEKRFSRAGITQMLNGAGVEAIEFGTQAPYWCALGWKRMGKDTNQSPSSPQTAMQSPHASR